MLVYIKVINNCKNTCHSAFLPLMGKLCSKSPRYTSHEQSKSSLEYIMSLTVLTAILANPHIPCPLSSHHPLKIATAQIWQLVQSFIRNFAAALAQFLF